MRDHEGGKGEREGGWGRWRIGGILDMLIGPDMIVVIVNENSFQTHLISRLTMFKGLHF